MAPFQKKTLETSKVRPLHKKGSTQYTNNYRSISLLISIQQNIFKKLILIHQRIFKFLENHGILYLSAAFLFFLVKSILPLMHLSILQKKLNIH